LRQETKVRLLAASSSQLKYRGHPVVRICSIWLIT
jgi:hypothetical protein